MDTPGRQVDQEAFPQHPFLSHSCVAMSSLPHSSLCGEGLTSHRALLNVGCTVTAINNGWPCLVQRVAWFALNGVLKEVGILLNGCLRFKNCQLMPTEPIFHFRPAPSNSRGSPGLQPPAFPAPPSAPSCTPVRRFTTYLWAARPPCPPAAPRPAIVAPRPAVRLKHTVLGGRVARFSI